MYYLELRFPKQKIECRWLESDSGKIAIQLAQLAHHLFYPILLTNI
jgi:hypothetical protein